jgi:hypothetical protein
MPNSSKERTAFAHAQCPGIETYGGRSYHCNLPFLWYNKIFLLLEKLNLGLSEKYE